jgi:hemerythrin superfamily protein
MAKQARSASVAVKSNVSPPTSESTDENAVTLLTADHRKVEQLFEQYQSTAATEQKSQLAAQICTELTVHTQLEEELFYPACRDKGVESALIDEAQVEHDEAKVLIHDLMTQQPGRSLYDAKVKVLSEYIKHHVAEEEKAGDGIFAKATAAGVDMDALGKRIKERKSVLLTQSQGGTLKLPRIRSLDVYGQRYNPEEGDMDRQHDRDRDEQGRFVSEGGGGTYYRNREDYDRDDEAYRSGRERGDYAGYQGSSGGYGGGRSRNEGRGYYSPYQDDRRGGYSGGGRDYDDDRGSSGRDRGEGGWFGDPQGNARASDEGWQQRSGRSGYPGGGRDYDEYRGGARGGYSGGGGGDYDDDRSSFSRGRGQGGWFGDPEEHSRASREGWQQRGGGHGGYEGRGGYRGRGRDHEESRHSGGHGGWFGDSEGHARAAEQGWRDRGSSRNPRGR